jgi:hypothetical protein
LLRFGAGFLLVAGPHLVWRVSYYGELIPASGRPPGSAISEAVPRNLGLLLGQPLFFMAFVAAALAAVLVPRRREILYLGLLAVLCAAISVCIGGSGWSPGDRLYLSAAALLLVCAGALADLGAGVQGRVGRWWAGPTAAVALIGAHAAAGLTSFPEVVARSKQAGVRDAVTARRLGQIVRAWARPGDWLAIRAAGTVPYYAGAGVRVLNMHERSLNDDPDRANGWSVARVLGRRPRFLVLSSKRPHALVSPHAMERQLYASRQLQRDYRHVLTVPWRRSHHLWLFRRLPDNSGRAE